MSTPMPVPEVTPPTFVSSRSRRAERVRWKNVSKNWDMYLLALIPIAYIIVFWYVPMYGAQIAFRDFDPVRGIWGSPWIGLQNFLRFFHSYNFYRIMRNTIELSLYQLLAGFPIPIVLAILLHYCPQRTYKRTVQMVTYAPHFISTVVMVGIIFKLFAVRIGIVNILLSHLGIKPPDWLGDPGMFPHLYVWTGVWQGMGWGSIIYLAALAGVDPELHESARVDGANIWQRIWYIDIPGILPTVVILFILRCGQILAVGFEKVFLMQNSLNIGRSEVIQTYVYKVGLASSLPDFSYASAIGLFTSVGSFVLLVLVNWLARRLGETSVW